MEAMGGVGVIRVDDEDGIGATLMVKVVRPRIAPTMVEASNMLAVEVEARS